jgi:phage/plasmid-associated DNA primase
MTTSERIPIRPGISEATIRKADVHYCDYPEKDSICIPYRDAEDHLTGFKRYRLPHPRPDGQKYHQDKGTGVFAYYTPGGLLVLPPENQFGLAPNSMLLVEGEFKALSLYDATVPVLGLPSFNVYQRDPKTNQPKLYSDIETAIGKWTISTVYFLGDADTVTNFEFSRQAAFLANILGNRLQIFLPRLPLGGPKGIDDYRSGIAQSFPSFFRELIRNAVLLDNKISPISLSGLLLEAHKADFASLKTVEKDRHFKRLIELCLAARRIELSPNTADLVDLVGEILRRGRREMNTLIKEADWRNRAQNNALAGLSTSYPPEFAGTLHLDGEPALFTYNDAGIIIKARLLEPFWARFYVERNDIVFVQETGQFKLYDPNIGVWEFLAPSSLEDELSVLIRQYAAKVPILADLDAQRSQEMLQHIRSQVRAKVTVSNPFQKERKFIHLKNTMLVWNEALRRFERRAFSKNFYSTARIDVDYAPQAECPGFLKFLEASLSADDIDLLQCWYGLVVLGFNPAKKLLINTGLRDRGKSQIVLIAKHLAGKGKFALLRTTELGKRFELGNIRDANLLYGTDVDRKFLMHEGVEMIKSLVGGDPLTGEVKYGLLPVEFRGLFNICLTTNEKLRIRIGHDPESWRNRIWIIEFVDRAPVTMKFDIGEHLWQEEAQGIVTWAIEGAATLLFNLAEKGKIALSQAQQARVDKLIAESVSVWEFVRLCIVQDPAKDMTTSELFENYSEWCESRQIVPILKSTFQEEIRTVLEEELHVRRVNDIERVINVTSPDGSTCPKPTQMRGFARISLSPGWVGSRPVS